MTTARDRARSQRTQVLTVLAWTLVSIIVVVTAATAVMWPRDDEPRDPDAVVVLGGFGQDRTDLGIRVRDRYDAVLVLSSSAAHFGEQRELTCDVEVMCIDPVPETTRGEARTVSRLAAEHGWQHVTVVTSQDHTTRARALFRQCLNNDVTVVGSRRPVDRRAALGHYLREAVGTVYAVTIGRAC